MSWGRAAWILTGAAMLALPAAGCTQHQDEATVTRARPVMASSDHAQAVEPIATLASAPEPVAASLPTTGESLAVDGTEEGGGLEGIEDSLPPDLVAAASATDVTPGGIIEITAKGSSDVVAMSLRDGCGTEQALTYDPSAGRWRVNYRVPMRTTGERLGLSVTARNGADHWRRVWVFLTPQPEVAAADSASGS